MSQHVALEELDWLADTLKVIETYARSGIEFGAADLRGKIPDPPHANMWGAAFLAARKRNLIEEVAYRPSKTRSRRHGRALRWRGTPTT